MAEEMEKIDLENLRRLKALSKEVKTSWVVCYTLEEAYFAQKAGIEIILIGDSLLMNLGGFPDTSEKTAAVLRDMGIDIMDLMIFFSQAVRKGAPDVYCIGDLPVNTYRTVEEAVRNAKRFHYEAGMDAVKLEVPIGKGREMAPIICAIVDAGIPVVVHQGTTPQTADGNYKTKGTTAQEGYLIIEDALSAYKEGKASMILLENITEDVGTIIAEMLPIPIASLGAGPFCDIVLVLGTDMLNKLGDYATVHPYFVEKFANVSGEMLRGYGEYRQRVKTGEYPGEQHWRQMDTVERKKLEERLTILRREQEREKDEKDAKIINQM